MSAGLHDHPGIFPTLPSCKVDPEMWRLLVEPNELGSPFRTCWEYVVTHELTSTERAAFWTAADLVFKSMRSQP